MKLNRPFLVAALALAAAHPESAARADEPQTVKIPQPGVPQIMSIEGRYVRAAYNNEGYAILGYKVANLSVGEKWMLLEVGITLRDGVPSYELRREAVSLETPDGTALELASVEAYRAANLRGLENRAKAQRDSINYFPPTAHQACRIGFFADLDQRAVAWDRVELTPSRACLGRFFFQIPEGIAYGQHWLNVRFAKSLVRVPFRILTKEEDKFLDKNYDSIEKQVEEAFKKKS